MYMRFILLCAHPVYGESHIHRNINHEVATTSPSLCNEPHRSHILFVKAAFGTNLHSTILLQSEGPSGKCAKLHTVAEKQQQGSPDKITLLLLVGITYASVWVIFLTHPVRGESHMQVLRNVN